MDTLNIHELLLLFISNHKFLFICYFLFTFIEYPIHYIYIPDFYGRVINSFKDNNKSVFIKYMKILTLLYILEWITDGCVMLATYFILPKFSEFATGTIFEYIIDHYELDFDNIPMGEILSKIIKMPYVLFEYINVIKNEILKYIFVFFNGFIHYSSISYNTTIVYVVFVIINYIFMLIMLNSFNYYELKSNNLQDKMYENVLDCLNNMPSIYTFNQQEYEKKRFYNTSFIDYKEVMFQLKGLYLKGNTFWGFIIV